MVTERPQTDLDPWKDEDERKRHDRRSRRIALAIVTAVVIIAAVAGGALLRDQPARQTSASASVQTTTSTHVTAPALQEGVYLVSIDDGSFKAFGFDQKVAKGGYWFHYSPDGTQIAFTNESTDDSLALTGTNQIYVMDADGSHVRQVTHEQGGADGAAWSFDGDSIAYELTDDPSGLAVLDLQTGQSRRVVWMPKGVPAPLPSWNPDGSEIAFGRNDGVSVVSLGAPGAVSMLLPRPATEAHWSPDGTQIAFDQNGQIVIAPLNGPERSVVDEGEAHWPSWSPNGTLLAYNHYSSSGRESVWLYDVKTGERRLFMDLAEQHGWADDDTLLVQAWG